MTKRDRTLAGILFLIALLLIAAFAFGLFGNVRREPEKSYSQLTGVQVDPETAERPVFAVMVENTEPARPQDGLDAAGIVFEAVTEGGITRYLALYQENVPEEIGPVRSLRTHFLDWAMGFDASIVHVGGSAEALGLAEERDAKSLNQFEYDEPYYRDRDRIAPHNMYVRTNELRDLQDELGHEKSQFDEIPRSSSDPSDNPAVESIAIDYSIPSYRVEFRYDPDTNSYIRYLNGEPHTDSSIDEPIAVKNVIVIKTADEQPSGVDAIGAGEALIFKNGKVAKVRWEKSSYSERIKVFNSEDEEVALNQGDSWFAVLHEDRPVTY